MGRQLTEYDWANAMDATIAVSTCPDTLLLEAYGAEAALGDHTFLEAAELQNDSYPNLIFHVQLRRVGDFSVVLESNGWTGSIPEVARRCSVGGHFFSVYWNENTDGQLTEAKDGRITARFNSVAAYYPYEVRFDTRPAWAIGPEAEPGTDIPLCLAHLEAQTGVAIQRAWLDEPMPTYRISDPAVLYPAPWI